ncbi:hypothetical protein GCM10009557_65590 [Virgisporangium ochraceum]
MSIATRYAEFAQREAHGVSPTYERLAHTVSADPAILDLLGTVPPAKQQPNLLFGVVRRLAGPVDDPAAFHDFTVTHWPAIEAELRARSTQTNEAGRCALLLPVLAMLPQPLALLEVGTAAGLCLYPDRYAYRYGHHMVGERGPVLQCAVTGRTPPRHLPVVVWRGGLDLDPVDVADPADVAWLDALIWPEHSHRRARLRAAAAIVAAETGPRRPGRRPPGAGRRGTGRCDACGLPLVGAVPGAAGAPEPVHRPGPGGARALDRDRESGGAAARGPAAASGRPAPQRARPRRRTPGLDPRPRPVHDLVNLTLKIKSKDPALRLVCACRR